MKVRVFIFLCVLTCIMADLIVTKKLKVPKMNEDCNKKIKCASIENPICVKMRRKDIGLGMYLVAANTCELKYLKCNNDLEAKIVPMKYCNHTSAPKVGDNKKGEHIRVKRKVKSENIKTTTPKATTKKLGQRKGEKSGIKGYNKTELFELKKARIIGKKLARLRNNHVTSNIVSKYSVLKDVKRVNLKQGRNPADFFETEEDSDLDRHQIQHLKGVIQYQDEKQNPESSHVSSDSERDQLTEGKGGHPIHIFAQEHMDIAPSPIDGRLKRPKYLYHYLHGEGDDEPQEKDQLLQTEPPQPQLEDFLMVSAESANRSKEPDEASKNEYETLCPTVCPSRNVMVCGRCQHGIYQSFISTCHMKMFSCHHHDEVLTLIARYPCVLSAPYMSEQGMKPMGMMQESEDDDIILRYLICQERGGFEKDAKGKLIDQRCDFPTTAKKLNLNFIDYKGVNLEVGANLLISGKVDY